MDIKDRVIIVTGASQGIGLFAANKEVIEFYKHLGFVEGNGMTLKEN